MADPRNPLIVGVTNDVKDRAHDKIPTSYAVNQLFAGELLDVNKDVNTVTACGNYRFQASTNNSANNLPSHMAGVSGILTVLHDRPNVTDGTFGGSDISVGSVTVIRQIAWPDGPNDITPYTRTKIGNTWGSWVTMGGNLRRIKLSANNTTAQTNVMYYSFMDYTLILPDPNAYPLGTQIGLEQWTNTGHVKWISGSTTYVQETTPAFQADATGTPITSNVIGPRVYMFEVVEDTNSGSRTWLLDIDNDDTQLHTYLKGQISSEQAARANADTILEGKVNATLGVNIANPQASGFITIAQRIVNEANTRSGADTAINNKLGTGTQSTSNAWSASNTIDAAIKAEQSARSNGDSAINDKLGTGFSASNTVATAISNEATARANADANKDRLHKAYFKNENITASTTFNDGNGDAKTLTELLKVVSPTITCGANVRSIALPTAGANYNGCIVNIELTGTLSCTITAGSDSESFTNTTGATLVLPFECVMSGASSYSWNLLVIA